MTKKLDLIYLVEVDDGFGPYWMQYASLIDAVSEHPKECVFTARPRLLGRFKMETKPKRIKPKKRSSE